MIDVTFCGHCDTEGCGLGYASYICPRCNEYHEDYEDLWFGQDNDVGAIVESTCENCLGTNKLKKITYDEYENLNEQPTNA